ncbi:CBS domain-containing protein, partial [Desulfonauticus submarinus]
MLVSKFMQTKLVLASGECRFKSLLCKIGKLAPRQIYIVNDKMELEGIITGYDLLKEVMPYYLDAKLARTIQEPEINDFLRKCIEKVEAKKAKDIMITEFVYLKPTDHVMEAEALIVERGINSLPVLDENKRLV